MYLLLASPSPATHCGRHALVVPCDLDVVAMMARSASDSFVIDIAWSSCLANAARSLSSDIFSAASLRRGHSKSRNHGTSCVKVVARM